MNAPAGGNAFSVADLAVTNDPYTMRLHAALLDAERRLTRLRTRRGDADPIVRACTTSLQQALQQTKAGAVFVAWDCLHQFSEEILDGLDAADVAAHWATIAAESEEKLSGWRLKAAEALKKKLTGNNPPPLEVVRELQRHLAAQAQNQQHKIEVYGKKTLPTLIWALALLIGGTLAFCYFVMRPDEPNPTLVPWAESFLLAMAAGAFGGILSMTFSLGRVDLSRKIPDMRLSAKVTTMRPMLGAAVAIVVVVFIEANYVKVEGFDKPLSIMAFCFIAGFSERWFLALVEKFEKA